MSRREAQSLSTAFRVGAAGVMLWAGLVSAVAQERELKIGYMKNPIQDARLR